MKRMTKRWKPVAFGIAATLLAGGGAIFALSGPVAAAPPGALWVSSATVGTNTSCTSPGYNTIQAAVSAAKSGATIEVCPGTYEEQVQIATAGLTIESTGPTNAVIAPTTVSQSATVEGASPPEPIDAIIDVEPGATNTTLLNLTLNGADAVNSQCSFTSPSAPVVAGVLYQANSSSSVSGHVNGLDINNMNNAPECFALGNGVFVQSAHSGTAPATVAVTNTEINNYYAWGISCQGITVSCAITHNTFTNTPGANNFATGILVADGAVATISANSISGNDTMPPENLGPEPQAEFANGILLEGAGINAAGVTTKVTLVSNNTLTDDLVGVYISDSEALISGNQIDQTVGITDSVGIFGVGCDEVCYLTDADGQPYNTVAAQNQPVSMINNTFNFASSPSGSIGIWMGDQGWSASPPTWSGPAGSEFVTFLGNKFSNVPTRLRLDSGANF